MTAKATNSSDRMKHGFRFHRMFTTGQKKKLHYQWDLRRLVGCCADLHVTVAGLILVQAVLNSLYINLGSNSCVSESKRKCGQYLDLVLQVLRDSRLFDPLPFRRLMSYIYIYGAPILDVSRSHTTTQHSR